jgi:hypothetical protein
MRDQRQAATLTVRHNFDAGANRQSSELSHSRFKCGLTKKTKKLAPRLSQARACFRSLSMRYAAITVVLFGLIQPAGAAVTPEIDPRASLSVVQQWIYNYRAKPDYAHVPAAVRVLFHAQSFREPESSGIYLGFIAGAIGSNPARAEQLIAGFFPVPPEDQWVIVRAIAYSGLPDWKNLLRSVAPRMPARKVMIDSYLEGALPTLNEIPLEEAKPGMFDKVRDFFTHNPFAKEDRKLKLTLTFASNQDLLDTLWGYYFATGSHAPILRIISMLPWSKSRDTLDKLTVGNMARYTLASYAVRDAGLREYLRSELALQPEPVKAPLREVVEAADTVELGAVRKDALAAVEELKVKGSDSRRNLDFWGQLGVGAVALGCVSAAALGQVAVGIPCVIGGSASQGLLSFWEKQQ